MGERWEDPENRIVTSGHRYKREKYYIKGLTRTTDPYRNMRYSVTSDIVTSGTPIFTFALCMSLVYV